MSSGIEAHLRDLESEWQDAEKAVDDYQDHTDRTMEALNNEVKDLVAHVQRQKLALREGLERKRLIAQRKADDLATFRV